MFALTRAGLIDRIGLENICGDMDHALGRAQELIAAKRAVQARLAQSISYSSLPLVESRGTDFRIAGKSRAVAGGFPWSSS